MRKHLSLAAAAFGLTAIVGSLVAAESLSSGPQVGQNARPDPFFPLNVTGPTAGKKACLVCRNGNNPVAMVFARDVSMPLTSLIKKLDAATVENKAANMGSFAIFCSDSEALNNQLKSLAEKEKLKEFVLAIDNPAGPEPYKIAKDAEVTVVLYNKSKVIANFVFKKGELDDKAIEKIVAEIPKIVK